MKLLNITTSYMLILILGTLSLWSVYFYFSINDKFYEDIDEYLMNRKFEILNEVKMNPYFLNQPVWKIDFKIRKLNKSNVKPVKDNFTDIQVYEPLEKEYEPYRKLETSVMLRLN